VAYPVAPITRVVAIRFGSKVVHHLDNIERRLLCLGVLISINPPGAGAIADVNNGGSNLRGRVHDRLLDGNTKCHVNGLPG